MVVAVMGPARAEQRIALKDLPPAVRDAVQRETTGATLKGLAKETEDGKTLYEVQIEVDGHARDLLFDVIGQLVEIEEEISFKLAPVAVRDVLASRGNIVRIEAVTRGDHVTYEAVVEKHGRTSEVALDRDGRVLKK
jgi:hypothetical protein